MYDKIKHYYEVEHRSIRWIARKTNLNFRTIKKYLEMDQKEFEDFSDHVINRPHILEPYKDFIIGKLSLYQETPAAQMHRRLHLRRNGISLSKQQIHRSHNANPDYAPVKENKHYILKYLLRFHKVSDATIPSSTRTRAELLLYGHPAGSVHSRGR